MLRLGISGTKTAYTHCNLILGFHSQKSCVLYSKMNDALFRRQPLFKADLEVELKHYDHTLPSWSSISSQECSAIQHSIDLSHLMTMTGEKSLLYQSFRLDTPRFPTRCGTASTLSFFIPKTAPQSCTAMPSHKADPGLQHPTLHTCRNP